MSDKKWPVLAKILIGLGLIAGIMVAIGSLLSGLVYYFVIGLATVVVYWNLYKFKKWALIGLNIAAGLAVLNGLVSFKNDPVQVGITIVYNIFVIVYFNAKAQKDFLA